MKNRRKHGNAYILRSNINKKFVQLQRIIYDLMSRSENLEFQRKFLHEFFNPKIDNAINTYREHINKMQKTSFSDYDFIVERTDRFYQRKMKNMLNDYNDNITKYKNQSVYSADELDKTKEYTLSIIKELNNLIKTLENDLVKIVEYSKSEMKRKIDEIQTNGKKELEEEIKKNEERDKRFILDSERHCKQMEEEHQLMIQKITNGYTPPKIDIQLLIAKKNEIKRILYDGQVKMNSLKNFSMNNLNLIKNKISQLIKEMTILQHNNNDSLNVQQKIYNDLLSKFLSEIEELNKKIQEISLKHQTERGQLEKEYQNLIKLLQNEYQTKKNNLNQNCYTNESQIKLLIKSLYENRKTIKISLEEKQKQEHERLEGIQKEIDESIQKFKDEINTFVGELSIQKLNHKNQVKSYQLTFISNREKFTKTYNEEISSLKNKLLKAKNISGQEIKNAQNDINQLQKERNDLLDRNRTVMDEFNVNEKDEIDKLMDEREKKINTLNQQISNMLEKEKNDIGAKINKVMEENKRKKDELIKRLQNKYENEMNLIKDAGYSKVDYNNLLKEFQNLHSRLSDESDHMVPFVIDDDVFARMLLVIKDLENELEDHKRMTATQRSLLNNDWEETIKKENSRFNAQNSMRPPSRARNQVIQSLKCQIALIQKTKKEEIEKLKKVLDEALHAHHQFCNNYNVKIDDEDDTEYDNIVKRLHNEYSALLNNQKNLVDDMNAQYDNKLSDLEKEHESQMKAIETKSCAVRESISQQISFFENKSKELTNTLNKNQMVYAQAYEESKRNSKCEYDRSKAEFIENEHLLQKKCKEQSFQNSRNHDSYHADELKQRNRLESIFKEKNDNNEIYIDRQKKKIDELKTEIKKRMDEMYVKKSIIVRKAGERTSRACDLDRIERLERQLSIQTNQLKSSLNEISDYRTLYVSQEKAINQHFGGMPEIGIFQMNQRRNSNITVI